MKKIIRIKNLCCANCGAKIERGIAKIEGVKEVALNFMLQKIKWYTLLQAVYHIFSQKSRNSCRENLCPGDFQGWICGDLPEGCFRKDQQFPEGVQTVFSVCL